MVRVTFVGADGTRYEAEGSEGKTVMETARSNGVPGIVADCGGMLSCSTCHVYVRPEWSAVVGGPGEEEAEMLEMAIDPSELSRLSCCISLSAELDGLTVDVPRSQV